MYRPLRTNYRPNPVVATTTMSEKGMNLSMAPQFLNVDYALLIQNYEIENVGKIVKRKGLTRLFQVAGNVPITLLRQFTDDVIVFGYGTTIARYAISTGVVTTIKNDFASGTFDGGKYGDYFFVCNGIGKIWRMDNSTFTLAEVGASPTGTVGLTFIGPRCYAWYGDSVQYSEVDTGSNPPFNTWTNATTATAGGIVSYRNAGDVRSVVALGENAVVFSDDGFFAFGITTFDSGGTLTKTENVINYTEDYGGARGAISTEKGVFYYNEQGLWNLVSIGQLNQPFSKQYELISYNLGDTYFNDIDFSNGDITYNPAKATVYFSGAEGSNTNNIVLSYQLEFKAFAKITNWNISRFMNIDNTFYGASDSSTTVYKIFQGDTDDGQIISTRYYQELKLGDLETRQMLMGCYTQGWLSASSQIKVRFDAYNENGVLVNNKLVYLWEAQNVVVGMDAYNKARYSSAVYNGDVGNAGLVESFNGCRPFIRNFQRLRVNITSSDRYHHILTWIRLDSRIKVKIRRRKLEQIS